MSLRRVERGAAAVLCMGWIASGPAFAAPPVHPAPEAAAQALNLLDVDLVELAIAPTPGQPVSVDVPIAGQTVTLDLAVESVRSPKYTVYAFGEANQMHEVEPAPVNTLMGAASIDGAPAGSVRGGMLADGLYARVRLGGEVWWLEPLGERFPEAGPTLYALYHQDWVLPSGGQCGVGDAPIGAIGQRGGPLGGDATSTPIDRPELGPGQTQPAAAAEAAPEGGGQVFSIAELGCDADYEYFLTWGSVANTEARINLVINLVNDQYQDEVGIIHVITVLIVRDNPNDPYTSSNAFTLIDQLGSWWLSNVSFFDYDLAHLFTGKELQGTTIGLAATGSICTGSKFSLAQSDCCCCPSLGCSTDLTAHELGHVWGAQHCSCQFPPKTMNPFLLCANTFSQGSINTINAFKNSVTCLDIGNPTVPPNDECANAINVLPGVFDLDTNNATTDGPVEFGPCASLQADVWYILGATETGTAVLDFCDANFDTVIALYEGPFCPDTPGSLIACNDDFDCDNDGSANDNIQSRLTFPVELGDLFVLRVGGANGADGTGTWSFEIEPPPCPPDLNGDGTIDSQDLNFLLAVFGANDQGDIDGDGDTDSADLNQVLAVFGEDCD